MIVKHEGLIILIDARQRVISSLEEAIGYFYPMYGDEPMWNEEVASDYFQNQEYFRRIMLGIDENLEHEIIECDGELCLIETDIKVDTLWMKIDRTPIGLP